MGNRANQFAISKEAIINELIKKNKVKFFF